MLYHSPEHQPFRDKILFGLLIFVLGWLPVTVHAQTPKFSADQLEFFEKEVRPLLSVHCYECHSANSEKLQAGLAVDSRAALIEGGDSGESIVPGDPDGSLFMDVVRWESYEMPPKGKLPDEDIETFAKWIGMGAPWPDEAAPEARAAIPEFDLEQRKQEFWVWQPVENPAAPNVVDKDWPVVDLDRFILAKLEENRLAPSADAEPLVVMRRLYQDIIGLPPTPEQVQRFLEDDAPDAIERLVDTLLASPHFGERWGRHWLDLMRYAETRGHEFDDDAINAFQYRDYVIRALNSDVPYDQLVREHIAGDLLEEPRIDPDEGFNESILGTGFWFLGEWVHSPVDILKDESDRFDNMVDVMSKSFLGVTVSCARCHDHKFDAISTADYYSLTGFLQSSDYRQVRFDSIQQNRAVAKELANVDAQYQQQIQALLKKHQLSPPKCEPLPEVIREGLVLDYGDLPPEEFMQNGFIFAAPRHAGDAILEIGEETPTLRFATYGHVVNDQAWNGLESISQKNVSKRSKLSKLPRSGRTLRTPTFEVSAGVVACVVRGQGHVVACVDSHRHIAGPLHGETVREINEDDTVVQMDLDRYIGHRIHLEFTPSINEQLEVAFVFQGTKDQIEKGVEAFSQQSVEVEADDFNTSVERKCGEELRELALSWAKLREEIASRIVKRSRVAMAMMDGTGEDAHILIRGNSSKPGDVEPRHFLSAVSGNAPMKIESGSGRLELASMINDPTNPLTARVMVNRIWHYLMGRGIVPTTDDFGVLGKRPTHPELLDHLATKFLSDGRSIKRMIRHIVLSRTYQMSCQPDAEAVQADPTNLLWHHRPPKRLEGEVIRDSLLSISGNLDDTLFGPPVPIHLTSFMNGRGKPKESGPLDGDGRRSIYVAIRRNFLSPFMLTFDTPTPFSTMGRRNVSNVPAQALALMNDPFVVQQSRDWAERAIQYSSEAQDRIEWMYVAAFSRKPSDSELAVALEFVDGETDIDRWSAFAHALINTKEFIFLR